MTVELNTPSTLADLIDKELMGVEPDSQCVVLDDADWKMITAALRSSTPEFTRCVECDGYNCADGCAYPSPAPTPAELVRYNMEVIGEGYNGAAYMAEAVNGEYVRHDEAAAMIAEKNEIIRDLETENSQLRGGVDLISKKRNEAVAELAQIKTQEPVGYLHSTPGNSSICFIHTKPPTGNEHWYLNLKPVYAAPVASEAETIERLREALTETRVDLVILSGNVSDAAKTCSKWDGMYERVLSWIRRVDTALAASEVKP